MKKQLDAALNEKDVENIYRDELLKYTKTKKGTIRSNFKTDGVLNFDNVKALLEFKPENYYTNLIQNIT